MPRNSYLFPLCSWCTHLYWLLPLVSYSINYWTLSFPCSVLRFADWGPVNKKWWMSNSNSNSNSYSNSNSNSDGWVKRGNSINMYAVCSRGVMWWLGGRLEPELIQNPLENHGLLDKWENKGKAPWPSMAAQAAGFLPPNMIAWVWAPGSMPWKERANSCKLSSDLHTQTMAGELHICTHIHVHIHKINT